MINEKIRIDVVSFSHQHECVSILIGLHETKRLSVGDRLQLDDDVAIELGGFGQQAGSRPRLDLHSKGVLAVKKIVLGGIKVSNP
ncbi:MAG: hypothetical protein ACFCVE_14120 [Phycisphaerae bacterium]